MLFRSYLKSIREICQSGGFDTEHPTGLPVHLPYKSMFTVIDQLKACNDVASLRTSNWQAFCFEEKSTLLYLFQSSFVLDDGLAPLLLQVIHTALSGVPPKAQTPKETKEPSKKESEGGGGGKGKGKAEKKEGKKEGKEKGGKEAKKDEEETKEEAKPPATDQETCRALVQLFLSFADDSLLLQFICLFLLQSNSTPLRWQAHALLHCLYQFLHPAQQVHLVKLLWQLWPDMPGYGHKASKFVDLLGYFTVSTPQVMEKEPLCQSFAERSIALLQQQNKVVATHPNSHIYSQLQSIVDFGGYYLESEPCLVCNDPEVPNNVLQTLTSINTLLERADQVYKLLVQHHNDLDQLLISLASGLTQGVLRAPVLAPESGVNRGIQLVAQRYCVDCKTTYQELSKIVQVMFSPHMPGSYEAVLTVRAMLVVGGDQDSDTLSSSVVLKALAEEPRLEATLSQFCFSFGKVPPSLPPSPPPLSSTPSPTPPGLSCLQDQPTR